MKIVEKKILKMVKAVAKKQASDPPIPGCIISPRDLRSNSICVKKEDGPMF